MGVDVYSISGRENERFRINLLAPKSTVRGDMAIYLYTRIGREESKKTIALGGDYSGWVWRSFCFFWLCISWIAFLGSNGVGRHPRYRVMNHCGVVVRETRHLGRMGWCGRGGLWGEGR